MANTEKEIKGIIKLQCMGGAATPAPPVGPALGQHGVPVGEFVQQFNARTAEMKGTVIPVEIYVYTDRTFSFILKSPPASVLLKKAVGVDSGSAQPNKNKVGKVSQKQLEEIAGKKMSDLNARNVEAAKRMIAGTARSMGIEVEG